MTPMPRPALGVDETVLWQGKPKKSAFIATKSLSLFPIAIVWLAFDLGFIGSLFPDSEDASLFFLLPFFLLHLTPVWLWLASLLTANRRYQNTAYYVTDRRLIIRHGALAVNEISLHYKDLRTVTTHVGLLDKPFRVGDVCFYTGLHTRTRYGTRETVYTFEELEDYEAVYARIQRILLDVREMDEP